MTVRSKVIDAELVLVWPATARPCETAGMYAVAEAATDSMARTASGIREKNLGCEIWSFYMLYVGDLKLTGDIYTFF